MSCQMIQGHLQECWAPCSEVPCIFVCMPSGLHVRSMFRHTSSAASQVSRCVPSWDCARGYASFSSVIPAWRLSQGWAWVFTQDGGTLQLSDFQLADCMQSFRFRVPASVPCFCLFSVLSVRLSFVRHDILRPVSGHASACVNGSVRGAHTQGLDMRAWMAILLVSWARCIITGLCACLADLCSCKSTQDLFEQRVCAV